MSKLDDKKIEQFELKDNKDFFGKWINDIDNISKSFQNTRPFNYHIIDNFLNDTIANTVCEEFPLDLKQYHKYYNPIEVKYANNKIDTFSENIQNIFYSLSSKYITNIFSHISGIKDLEYDKTLHGAGLHLHPRYGRLGLHLDYEKHPLLENKERRLNIIIYLSKDWKPKYNGATELWEPDLSKCFLKSQVKFNSAIIFQTNDLSFHGLPEKILCPEGMYRKSLAYYYISPITASKSTDKLGANEDGYRLKATFIKHPYEANNEKLDKLLKIRPSRLITEKDMKEIWKDWTPEIY